MKRLTGLALIAALLLLCAALAEANNGWAQVTLDATIREQPDASSPVVAEVPAGVELEYLGHTQYDANQLAWYDVLWKGSTGWIDAQHATLMWPTLY